jgi:hypothetical protein
VIIKLVNCANCRQEAVGLSCIAAWEAMSIAQREQESLPVDRSVGGHIHGRPWCNDCLRRRPHQDLGGGGIGDPSPWQENAIREMEDRE